MAYNVITDTGTIDTITFTNSASSKNATVFAGLQDTDKNINVLTDTLLPTYNISYDDSQTNWCTVTLSNTDDAPNTAKKISVSVTENTANNDRGCKIYLKYKDKSTPNYIQINQSKPATQEPGEATIRVYNNTNDDITGKHFVILTQVSTGVPLYYMTVLDTYNKTIPAHSTLDVGTNTEVTGYTGTWYAYVNETSSVSVNIDRDSIKDVSHIQNTEGTKQGNHYVTSSSATLNNGVITYTGGASPDYRIGINTNESPTGYVCNDYPKSIAIFDSTQAEEQFYYVNTLSVNAWNQNYNGYAFWLCLVVPNVLTTGKQIGCRTYIRQNSERNNNAYMQDVWTRTSMDVDSILAKKINPDAINGAASVFGFGDNTLRIYIFGAPTENDINDALIYRVLIPAFTQEFEPITDGAIARSGITSSQITKQDYGTWYGSITVFGRNDITSGNTTYLIPIFVIADKYITSAT